MASTFDCCVEKCVTAVENNNDTISKALNPFAEDPEFIFFGITSIVDYSMRRILEKKFVTKIFAQNSLHETGIFDFLETVSTLPSELMDVILPFTLVGATCEICTVQQIDELFQFLERENTHLYNFMSKNLLVSGNSCYLSLLSTCKV
jgi:hypothetical protein